MSTVKAAGATKNLRDSKPKYLGTKLYDGEKAQIGSIIVRQRGTPILAGKNVAVGKDHTLFAMKPGTVKFRTARKESFDGTISKMPIVDVIEA
jgi:large subunit ribosomal protein L27